MPEEAQQIFLQIIKMKETIRQMDEKLANT